MAFERAVLDGEADAVRLPCDDVGHFSDEYAAMTDETDIRHACLATFFQMERRPRAGENGSDVGFALLLFAWIKRVVKEIPIIIGDSGDVERRLLAAFDFQ